MHKIIAVFIFLMLSVFLLTGCDDSNSSSETISVTLNYDSSAYETNIKIASDKNISYFDCTDFIKFFYESDGEKVQVESAKSNRLDSASGYFLDNEMVYPIGLGCDNLVCTADNTKEYRYKLLEYEYKGERTLTEAEKEAYTQYAVSDVIPDSLSEYVSHPLSGKIFIEINYYETDDCDMENQKIYSGSFIIE